MAYVYPEARGINTPPHRTLSTLLAAQAARQPEAFAILAPGRVPLTYGHLQAHVHAVAHTLHATGLGRQDRIALILPASPEMVVAFLAVTAAATCAPLNPAYNAAEFDFYLTDLCAKALIVHAALDSPARAVARARGIWVMELSPQLDAAAGLFRLASAPAAPTTADVMAQPDDVALVLHTAGTTSQPKIVPLTHANLCTAAHNMCLAFQLRAEDLCLNVLPFFHLHAIQTVILASLAAGGSMVCTPAFTPRQFFSWLEVFHPTWYTAVPTIHQAIVEEAALYHQPLADSALRFIRSGSAALPASTRLALERVFHTRVIETYGLTETSGHITCNPPPAGTYKSGSVGLPVGPEVAIMDEAGHLCPAGTTGEIVVRGATVMSGYDNDPIANQNVFTDGWFRTGDEGYRDAEGYLFVTGRFKEIINRGGEKIAPQEVDDVLMAHPAVAQAVTFAIPHARLGEDIAAAVVLHHHAVATDHDLRQFAATRLAPFKVPRQICIVQEIPTNAIGKPQRFGLAQQLGLTTSVSAHATMLVSDTAPRTPIEDLLVGIWATVLDVEHLSIHENFFDLGGHSLLVAQGLARIQEALQVEVPPRLVFDAPTVADLAQYIETMRQPQGEVSVPPLVPRSPEGVTPASVGQEALWVFDQILPRTPFFNIPYVLHLQGRLDVAALERSFTEIIRRHEALRTTFTTVAGQLLHTIAPAAPMRLMVHDLRPVPADVREAEARQRTRQEAQRPFDLERGPLLQVCLVQLGEQEYLLPVTLHHIISDGWSIGVLARELAVLYDAFVAGKPSPLPELPVQYADFTAWQRQWQRSSTRDAQLAYWQQQLHDPLPRLHLAMDHAGSTGLSFRIAHQPLILPRALAENLITLSRRHGSTLFMTLLAAFKIFLQRETDQDDICVGTLVANRTWQALEGLIGLFANTLMLRTHLGGQPTFPEVLKRVRDTTLAAYAHQALPFEDLMQTLERQRHLPRTAICQAMFILQHAQLRPVALPSLTLSLIETEASLMEFGFAATTCDLIVVLRERPQGLVGACIYKASLFEATTISRMLDDFQRVLEDIISTELGENVRSASDA